jgi:hypothetical protein
MRATGRPPSREAVYWNRSERGSTLHVHVPIHLLLPSILIGVTLVMLATWFAGERADAVLDEATATHRFLVDYPGASVQRVELSQDRRAALLSTADDVTGVVFAVGARFATRTVDARRAHYAEGVLHIDFGEHGAPPLALRVSDAWESVNA